MREDWLHEARTHYITLNSAHFTCIFLSRSLLSAMLQIWFTLVDSAGQAYKQSTADKVSIAGQDADVSDLRRAIKAACPSLLAHCDPPQLYVYRNKEAFETNKKGHLNEELKIAGLGASKQSAVVVLVPPPLDTIERQPASGG